MKRGPGQLGPDPFTGIVMAIVAVVVVALFVLQACRAAFPGGCRP